MRAAAFAAPGPCQSSVAIQPLNRSTLERFTIRGCARAPPCEVVQSAKNDTEPKTLRASVTVQLRAGVVHPWVGQIRLKRNGFKTLFKS